MSNQLHNTVHYTNLLSLEWTGNLGKKAQSSKGSVSRLQLNVYLKKMETLIYTSLLSGTNAPVTIKCHLLLRLYTGILPNNILKFHYIQLPLATKRCNTFVK